MLVAVRSAARIGGQRRDIGHRAIHPPQAGGPPWPPAHGCRRPGGRGAARDPRRGHRPGRDLGGRVPGERSAGPAAWVQPGTRIVYYVASASVAQSRYQYVAEPCDPKRVPVPVAHDGSVLSAHRRVGRWASGAARGSGYAIIDVVAADGPGQVVTAESLLRHRHRDRRAHLSAHRRRPESSGAVDAVWLHPAILEDVLAGATLPGGPGATGGPLPAGGHDLRGPWRSRATADLGHVRPRERPRPR